MNRKGMSRMRQETEHTALQEAARLIQDKSNAPADLVSLALARLTPDDLRLFDGESFAIIAEGAWQALNVPRTSGNTTIRLDDRQLRMAGHVRDVTLLQIVNDNKPFLLDSTLAELEAGGREPLFVIHPILGVERRTDGAFVRLATEGSGVPGTKRESMIEIVLDRLDDPGQRADLIRSLERVFGAVNAAVRDWSAMRTRIAEAARAWRDDPPPIEPGELAEAEAFLDWMLADHFTILGSREYRIPSGDIAADPVEGTGLGILADPALNVLRKGRELVAITPEVRTFLAEPVPLIIAKASVKSLVHRRVHMDYVGVKLFGSDGAVTGELRVIGLFTSSAYTDTVDEIPVIRRKATHVIRDAGVDRASYSGRALRNILEFFPRDELFQIDVPTLSAFSQDIMSLYERPRVMALPRVDRFDRFVSILVFILKDHDDTRIREKIAAMLARLYQGRVSAVHPAYPEGPLARIHIIIGRDEGTTPDISRQQIEETITSIVRSWADSLRIELDRQYPGSKARALSQRWGHAFSMAYREAFGAEHAVADITILEQLSDTHPRAARFERREGDAPARANLQVYVRGDALPLSERVPPLEAMGFRVMSERTYRVLPDGERGVRIWLHDMLLERATNGAIDVKSLKPKIESLLYALGTGQAESDRFNALTLEAGLGWREIAALRTLSRYLQQARVPFSQDYMAATLATHPHIAKLLVALFHARFDPRNSDASRQERQAAIRAELEAALEDITSLDEDRIIRRFINLIGAALRTNFYQLAPDGQPRPAIAFKFDSIKIDNLPLPRPHVEIFVHSPRVEGVHLRFGSVARGGLRWSDRQQDFRTEVLGLVKAQQVKNAVIVPVGAKGGFYPKKLPLVSDRQAFMEEGIAAYKLFVGTMLDLTDNIVGGAIVPPADTVRHDGDDPYLVVAADKGTATFSDIANALSQEHGFWLDDAFASGGSQGYDHKKMGITARGAWEAVKRHFREMDRDIQASPFTVCGVGDMSGDVFGNGMLLSRTTRLVAAFDHRDIFIDPSPDAEKAWAERKRLFDLPRSSWQDYDKTLISQGGGVFSRGAKKIPLSDEMRALFGVTLTEMTPTELIRAILTAKVDLLWFGGIGTYLRASTETDEDARDRANDAIRITGLDVNASVIGEGANLGCTQLGRIEAAIHGVRLNTDAIDNSAGVNTSDVEVNIKIALASAIRDDRLDTERRNALLASMTDEVAHLVLRNNETQTLALSLAQGRGTEDMAFARRLMQVLENAGRLDRDVEYLPDDARLTERETRGEGLTRPELAVLLAYAKMAFKDALLKSEALDKSAFEDELFAYFPDQMRTTYAHDIRTHRLRRDIIATRIANAVIDRGSPTASLRLIERTGADAGSVALSYLAARDSFGLNKLDAAIDALNNKIPSMVQNALYAHVQDALLGRMLWFIRNIDWLHADAAAIIARFRSAVNDLKATLDPSRLTALATPLLAQGVPDPLAKDLVALQELRAAQDLVLIVEQTGKPIGDILANHNAVGERFGIANLIEAAGGIPALDYYDRLALDRAIDMIDSAHRTVTKAITLEIGSGETALDAWIAHRGDTALRFPTTIAQLLQGGATLSKMTIASGLLDDLVQGPGT
jgi:glutamate dehydrogenase